MLTLACAVYLAMGSVWFGAASVWQAALWLRWVLVGPTALVGGLARFAPQAVAHPPRIVLPLVLLVVYGIGTSVVSSAGQLSFTKTVAFGATVAASLLGGLNLVDRLGRDGVLSRWRILWRVFLVVGIAGYLGGFWRTSSAGLQGPTGNPNMLASFLMSFGLVMLTGRGALRWPFFLESAAAIALLLATRSRAALAAIAAATLAALFLGHHRRRWVAAGAVLAVSLVSLLSTPDTTVRGVEDYLEVGGKRHLLATRESEWAESWDAMVAGLPLGFGWGVKRDARDTWSIQAGTVGYGREEGTSWLPIGEELGLPGYLLWGWIWWVLFTSALRGPRTLRPFAVGGLVYFFVLATFEGWLLSPGNWESFAFWTFVGVALARPSPASPLPVPAPSPRLEPAESLA